MDMTPLRARQKELGVTNDDLARAIKRDRSVISRIWSGDRPLKPEEVPAFAEALGVKPDFVIEHAGLTYLWEVKAPAAATYFAEDAARWDPKPGEEPGPTLDMAKLLGGGRAGIDIWQVKGGALMLEGYRDGDFLLVDHNAAERARAGDVVIAQVYDWNHAAAATLVRRYEPPVLVAASLDPADRKVHVVDGNNVAIKGIVIGSWRGGVKH